MNENETKDTFDKQAMLTNMADNVILPAYTSFKTSLDSLVTVYNTFKSTGSLTDFQLVKQKYSVAYLNYQRCDLFEMGPAEATIIRANFNVFPTDTAQIKSNISSGSYDLGVLSNIDAKGFPAIEFLLYGNNSTETDIIKSFTISPNRKQYVSNLLAEMVTKTNYVVSTWNASYRNTFVTSLGTDVGSSIGFLVNQINFELDYLKNAKIGIPLGKKSLGVPVPEACEAYYTSKSISYAKETLLLIENTYLGRSSSGSNGKGFDDYLAHLDIKYNGGSLNDAINAQFAIAKTKLNAIPNPLSTQVTSNGSTVDAAYAELVKLLVLLKTDMPSNLGVIITYQDGDGD
ncbi:MAG: imelysin family protein [Bacteroidota bacterium]|nr:imelysin family protein [Bacteroidota bacterium]